MQDNVFDEKVDYLYQVQTDLEAVEQLRLELAEYNNQEKNLKRAIATEEKSIQDEIALTLRKRKSEIERAYDHQIDANKSKAKSVRLKRDKTKSKRVDERVENETAHLAEENRQLQMEMKTLFKAQHVPKFCRSRWYYSLFMTKRMPEFLVLIMSSIVVYVGIPVLIYLLSTKLFYKENPNITLLCTLTVSVTLFVLGLIYVIMVNAVKIKHYDTLLEGRCMIDKIAANQRQMRAIRNTINKDKDESTYGLEKYDDKLMELELALDQISIEKQDAMTVFEKETKQLLTEEVNNRRLSRLEEMQEGLEQLEKAIALVEEDIEHSDLAIMNHYGAVLGKEFCTSSKVADLISLMEDGTADTVSEAIAAYRGASR